MSLRQTAPSAEAPLPGDAAKLEPKAFKTFRRRAGLLFRSERRLVFGILLIGLVHGLIYLLIEPPWEHYEEPSHFEYAWLISHTGQLPQYPAYNQDERRLIAGSMIAHGFFARRPLAPPDLNSTDQPIWIGVNTTGAMPLYHLLVALSLRATAGLAVDAQLYTARGVSLLLFVLTIGLAYLLVAELVPPGHSLRWAVPLSLALLPGFADLMTGVSNDVGATFMFSLFLWASVRLILRGFSLARLLGLLALFVLCVLTKNTLFITIGLVLIPIGMALWLRVAATHPGWRTSPRTRRWLRWGLLALPLLAVVAVLGLMDWTAPALWYRYTPASNPGRLAAQRPAPGLGNLALGFTRSSGQRDVGGAEQIIPYDRVIALRGQTLTLGAWIWASQAVSVNAPALVEADTFSPTVISVGPQPAFFAWPVNITAGAQVVRLLVQPGLADDVPPPATVYYDGLVLAAGARPVNSPPIFSDSNAAQGTWGGQPFVNEVRNASVQQSWPTVRSWVEQLVTKFTAAYISPSTLLGALLDWRLTHDLYVAAAVRLFRTFWGAFSWGNVELPYYWYALLRYATLLGMVIGCVRLLRVFGQLSRARQLALLWLGVALLAVWGEVFLRGFFTVLAVKLYIPTARYAYPVIIPAMFLLVGGWSFWPWPSGRSASLLHKLGPMLFCAVFLVLDVQSIVTVIAYYRG